MIGHWLSKWLPDICTELRHIAVAPEERVQVHLTLLSIEKIWHT